MSSLARIQADLQSFLLRSDEAVKAHVVDSGRVSVETRLGIYHHAYRARLVEALCANYPVLAHLLGAEAFAQLGAEYIDRYDSSSFSVRHYGHALSTLVKTPFLADLARWEWTIADVFDAADAEPVRVPALAAIAPDEWGELRFAFHPSTRHLALASNAVQVWKAVTANAQSPTPSTDVEPTTWLLWRRDVRTLFRSLSTAEAQMIDGAIAGRPFGELCIALCSHCTEEEAPARAAGFLREWVESGLIVEVRR
jgi:hypothetical protein